MFSGKEEEVIAYCLQRNWPLQTVRNSHTLHSHFALSETFILLDISRKILGPI